MPKRSDKGLRRRSVPQDGIFNGMTAPLWNNPSIRFFEFQYYQSQVQGAIFGVVGQLTKENDCEVPLIVISEVNNVLVYGFAIVNLMYMNLSYATDCEWFKYLVFLLLINIIQSLVLLGTLLLLWINFNSGSVTNICAGKNIFQEKISVALMVNVVGITVLLIQSFFSLSFIYVKFYILNSVSKFYYKQTREVMLLD